MILLICNLTLIISPLDANYGLLYLINKKCAVLYFGSAIRRPFLCYYTLDNAPIPVNTSYKDRDMVVLNNLNCSNLILRAFYSSGIPKLFKLFL